MLNQMKPEIITFFVVFNMYKLPYIVLHQHTYLFVGTYLTVIKILYGFYFS